AAEPALTIASGTDTPRVGVRDIRRRQLPWTRAERGVYECGHPDGYAADPGCLWGTPQPRHASTNRRRAGGADGFFARRYSHADCLDSLGQGDLRAGRPAVLPSICPLLS